MAGAALAITQAMFWSVAVTLDGAPLDNVIGSVRTDLEESAAGIVEFSIYDSATFDARRYVGKAVTFAHARTDGPGGATVAEHAMLRGVVTDATHNPQTDVIALTVTDDLQGAVTREARAALTALIGQRFSGALFGDDLDNWEYTRACMECQRAALELDGAGTLTVTPWAPKAAPDYTFTVDEVLQDSLSIRPAPLADITTRVILTIAQRFTRQWQRSRVVSWDYGRRLIEHSPRPAWLPNRELIRQALEATGWQVASLTFTPVWDSGTYPDGAGGIFIFANSYPQGAIGMSARMVKRWEQTVTHESTVTIEVAGQAGAPAVESSVRVNATVDAPIVEAFEDLTIEPDDQDPAATDFPLADSTDAGEGFRYHDKRVASIATALGQAALEREITRIESKYRALRVTFTVPIQPHIDRSHTVRIDTPDLRATGKVYQVEHEHDLSSGRAITRITLAVRHGGGGAGDAVSYPPAPDPVSVGAAEAPVRSHSATQIGRSGDTYSEARLGLSTNYQTGAGDVFPQRFLANLDNLPARLRESIVTPDAYTLSLAIPDDEIELP